MNVFARKRSDPEMAEQVRKLTDLRQSINDELEKGVLDTLLAALQAKLLYAQLQAILRITLVSASRQGH